MTIDLNCDLGESFGVYQLAEQEELLQVVSSANIACGFHAGDPAVMRETIALANYYQVHIGAHPGLPDLAGFGRREMQVTPQEVYDMVLYQIGALQAMAAAQGVVLHHVKPHGALYNQAAKEYELAYAIAKAVHAVSPHLYVYGLAGSQFVPAAAAVGIPLKQEVFADRTYQADGRLTPRSQEGAIIASEEQAIRQVLQLVQTQSVQALTGERIPVVAETLCLHGDTPQAVAFAKRIQRVCMEYGISIE